MTKTDIVKKIYEKTDLNLRDSEDALELVLRVIKKELKEGKDVIIRKFGRFHVRKKKARMARNPRTGEPAKVSARRVVQFKCAQTLKEEMNR